MPTRLLKAIQILWYSVFCTLSNQIISDIVKLYECDSFCEFKVYTTQCKNDKLRKGN